jgi:N-acetylglucosamine kinase-like BadF-type ATPase
MLHFLALDIGGSKTRLVVFDETDSEIEICETIGVGLAVDSEDDIPELRSKVTHLAQKYNICSVAVNLGGKNKNQITKIVKDCIPIAKVRVFRESEGAAPLEFGQLFDADAVLLAGTGAIAVAKRPDGSSIVCGGWGMNISDEGSGYYIGLEAIKQSLAALDKNIPLTDMQKEITGLNSPISISLDIADICSIRDGVRSRLQPIDRKHIASYCKIVVKHCENGQQDALKIMQDAGRHLGLLVADSATKLMPYEVKKVAVSGGLVNCLAYWQENFEKTVKENCTIRDFVYDINGVMLGTKSLAKKI